MADEKKKMHKQIKEYYDRGDKIEALIATTRNVHTGAYTAGLDAIRDSRGRIDYNLLENDGKKEEMLDKMVNHYITEAMSKLVEKGITAKIPQDEFEQDMFLMKYVGVTRATLRKSIGPDYTEEKHEQLRNELIKKQTKELNPLRHGHFKKGDIATILDHMGIKKHFNVGNLEEAATVAPLLDVYKAKGELTLADLANTGLPKPYFTDNANSAMKKLKDVYKSPQK